MTVLALFGLVLGAVGGTAAYLVVHLVGLVSNLALLHRVGFGLPDLEHYHPSWVLLPVAVAGAFVVVGLAAWSPIIKGHGIPESLDAILFRASKVAPRTALAKPLSAAVAMGTGGPFGAEGPIIVTGAAVGSLVGQLFPVSPAERRILLATGAAAGMAGVFATPIAAVVLAFELLLFERSLRALLPLSVATAVAAALHGVLLGARPLFPLDYTPQVLAPQLPLFVVVGVAAGALAVALNRGLFAVERAFRRLPLPAWSHPVLGALGYALIGLAVPGSLSVGYWAITDAVNGRFMLGAAAVLFAAKTLSWWIGLGSSTSGGTLAPMFLVGACMGEMIGIGFAHLFPGSPIQPGAFALVGMGVTFGVGARALLTGVVFAAEVTGGFGLFVPLMLATAAGELVAERGLRERIMTDKLLHRGYRVDFDTQTDPLRMRTASSVMCSAPPDASRDASKRPPDPAIDRMAFLADALPHLLQPDCQRVAVTDEDHVIGYVTREHLDAELRRRISDDVISPPTLRLPKSWPAILHTHDSEHEPACPKPPSSDSH
jgi:H+/Cl- antiporter ClcA